MSNFGNHWRSFQDGGKASVTRGEGKEIGNQQKGRSQMRIPHYLKNSRTLISGTHRVSGKAGGDAKGPDDVCVEEKIDDRGSMKRTGRVVGQINAPGVLQRAGGGLKGAEVILSLRTRAGVNKPGVRQETLGKK